ncbi:MAG: signal peptidase II [Thermodesulfobacteriota bacterium]
MTTHYRNQMLIFASVSLGMAALDQITKQVVVASIPPGGSVEIVPGLVNMVHTMNPGAAFGFLAGYESDYRWWFFVGVSAVVVTALLLMTAASPGLNRLLLIGYACFMGGAVGNLIDRIRFGAVVDFMDVYWGALHWPAFNVADSALCVGTGLFLLCMVTGRGTQRDPLEGAQIDLQRR